MSPDFYISSSEGHMEGDARSCFFVKRLRCGNREDCILVRINPPVKGEHYGLGNFEIHEVLLASRLKGTSVISPIEWPVSVYVLYANINNLEERDSISMDEYRIIAWAEIYKDKDEAPSSNSYTFGD